MTFNKKLRLVIALLTLSLITGCLEKDEEIGTTNIHQEISERGIQSGIIGDLNFTEIATTDNPEVNIIQVVNHKKKEVQSQASGTRLRDYTNKKDYILTAAHLLSISFDDYKPSDFILFVARNGSFDNGDWYKISPKLFAMINPEDKDTVLIPVDYNKSASAYDISTIFPMEPVNLPYKISIISQLNLKYAKNLRKVKQSANLLGVTYLSSPHWKTDADLFLGMSGSPAFNENQKIVGIVSRLTKLNNCNVYNGLLCHNIIAPVEQDWVKAQTSVISKNKLLLRIDG